MTKKCYSQKCNLDLLEEHLNYESIISLAANGQNYASIPIVSNSEVTLRQMAKFATNIMSKKLQFNYEFGTPATFLKQ